MKFELEKEDKFNYFSNENEIFYWIKINGRYEKLYHDYETANAQFEQLVNRYKIDKAAEKTIVNVFENDVVEVWPIVESVKTEEIL